MEPLSTVVSKAMLPFLGKPLLHHTVQALRRAGIQDLILVVSSSNRDVQSHFSDGSKFDLTIRYYQQEEWPGTAGVVEAVSERMSLSDPFLVVYGDSLVDLDFRRLQEFHLQVGSVATVAGHRPRLESFLAGGPSQRESDGISQRESDGRRRTNYGVMEVGSNHRVIRFEEKPYVEDIQLHFNNPLASAAVFLVTRSAMKSVAPAGAEFDFGYHLFPSLVNKGAPIFAFDINTGYRIDIGTPQHYLSSQLAALKGLLPLKPTLSETPKGVWTAPDVQLDPAATVRPPVLLCQGVRVGPGSRIYCTVLSKNVVVAPGASLENSLVLDGVYIGAGATVLNSVVGPDSLIGDRVYVPRNSVIGHSCQIGVEELVLDDEEFRSRFNV